MQWFGKISLKHLKYILNTPFMYSSVASGNLWYMISYMISCIYDITYDLFRNVYDSLLFTYSTINIQGTESRAKPQGPRLGSARQGSNWLPTATRTDALPSRIHRYIIDLWHHRPIIIWLCWYDIIPRSTMISVLHEIIGIWYHSQYRTLNHI